MKQYGDATTTDISKLQNGNQIYLNGLQVGAPYTFYAVVHAQDGTPSHLFKATFTPSMNVDYILADSADYEYGLPRLSGEWKGSNRYILSVEKPAECVKYWLFQGDPEYFLGDVWSNTDKLVAEELYGVEVHTDSFSNKTYSHMHNESRFYVAWVDDKGRFHAIYEYNPHN